jgi:nitrate reductase NapE component
MVLFVGPRLDRPSAVGDEGRPRATSLTVAAVVVVALFAAVSAAVGRAELVPAVGFLVGVTVAGAALLGRNRLGPLVLGHLCVVPFASALLAVLVFALATTPYGVLVTGFTVAALAIAATWTDVARVEHVRSVLAQVTTSYVSMLFGVAVVALVGGFGLAVWILLSAFVGGVGPTASAVGFAVLAALAGFSLRVALRALPVAEFAARSRRDAVAARVTWWRRRATLGALGCLLAAVGLGTAGAAGLTGTLYATVPATAVAFSLLSTPIAVGAVVAVATACLLAAVVAWLARRLTRRLDPSATRRTAGVLAGALLVVASVPLTATALSLRGSTGLFVGVVLALVGPVGVLVVGGVAVVAVEFGLLPDRAAGPALAAAGVVVATVGAALASLPTALVLACAAGALVVWDTSSFGLGVTAELGHRPETRRLELLHAVLGVGLGIAAVAALTALDLLRTWLGPTAGATSVAALAVVGVLLLVAPLRG